MARRELFMTVLLASVSVAFAAWSAQALVGQKDKMFHPDDIEAKVGEVVVIANDDDVAHNVIYTTPGRALMNVGLQKPGANVEITMSAAGDFIVRCGIHPKMKLAIHAR